jgi:hypothetical protein
MDMTRENYRQYVIHITVHALREGNQHIALFNIEKPEGVALLDLYCSTGKTFVTAELAKEDALKAAQRKVDIGGFEPKAA